MELVKRTRLKRKWLVVLTIAITFASVESIKLVTSRIDWIKKEVEQCDQQNQSTCSTYNIRHYLINK